MRKNFNNPVNQIVLSKLKHYWPLIKSLQTGLLLLTGITGYMSARCPVMNWYVVLGLFGSLFLTISGSTVLNMLFDRDIDSKMKRTKFRPLPSGKLSAKETLFLGLFLSVIGLAWSFVLSNLFGVIVLTGWLLDVAVYTIWLKRRTPWSIVWGGISGGMPILAGRVLGLGEIDFIGILLSISILLWIPTHILTFNMRHFDDYKKASIPTFPSTYGYKNTLLIIALSSLGAAIAIGIGSYALGMAWGYLRLLAVMSVVLIGIAGISIYQPSENINFRLFKFASIYMLSSMLLVAFGV